MNKWNYFRKLGAAISGGVILSSVVVPSSTVAADELFFHEDKVLNKACNESWLSWLYWIFRFDFVKNYVFESVEKRLVHKNFEDLVDFLSVHLEGCAFTDGGMSVLVSFGKSFEYKLDLCCKSGEFKLQKQKDGSFFELATGKAKDNYENSVKAFGLLKKFVLTKELFDLLEGSLKPTDVPYKLRCDFSEKNITCLDARKLLSIDIIFADVPWFAFEFGAYSVPNVRSVLTDASEMEKFVDHIRKQLKGKKEGTTCDANISSLNLKKSTS